MMEKNRGSMSSIVDKHGVLSKRKLRSESADDDLSDINDAEITGYLNNKKEMLFKKFIWEAMNKDYQKGLSSKINYDALEKLNNEPEEKDSEKAKEGIDSNRDKQIEREHSKGSSTLEDGGFEEDNFSDESEHENAYLCSYEEDEEYGYGEDNEYEEY
ncbi:hypothetical protein ERO13_A06G141400v2 [Gossypium hirsutum]|uniref:Brf1 TBP-binding domain-containing protein n=3 Tax=Gossypium TaxID=3633 RepID=A0A5J5VFU2_GOSBA|nr:uncharacterized protein LOC108485540 isoform X3 [Gossypium arboreum]KAB2078303.1 hypothetical protein ES319_A06G153300v1 [Gossypium barbadense]KAG4195970.1 hypothetical protein ERO13_A06G141400v2 [Gossypium hirsutum]TYH13873.1 hypothetical protein ES288_A06G174300v1 [Gossypium darwinii]TYJ30789.1 hypothetical protein E1A91_A06G153800v1 [Gossypium mustelinum]